MRTTFDAEKRLLEAGIAPTLQRLAVLEDLYKHRTHATTDEILSRLRQRFPKFTQRTVYNALNLFVEKGVIATISIDENCARYDYMTDFHAHFRCRECGTIFDIDMQPMSAKMPFAAKIDSEQHFLYGICNDCQKKQQN